MNISRAVFLKTCGLALVGAGIDPRTLTGVAAMRSRSAGAVAVRPSFDLADATPALFRDQLDTAFAVRAADGTRARLVLAKVAERPLTKNVEQFSLIFHGAASEALTHGTHAVDHAALGVFDLFIVPVGAADGRRAVYQACFSRHVARAALMEMET